jgi:hypothetical protein
MTHRTTKQTHTHPSSLQPARAATPLLLVLGLAATLVGCSGARHPDDDDDDSAGSPRTTSSNTDACTGTYDCNFYEAGENQGEIDGRLVRKNSACVWQASADSSITFDLSQATITGRTFTFYDSTDDAHLTCWPPGTTCRGTVHSCSYVGANACYHQDGCYYAVNSAYSTSDDSCEGVATSCSDLNTEFSCQDQSGCVWQ